MLSVFSKNGILKFEFSWIGGEYMENILLDYSKVKGFIGEEEILSLEKEILDAHDMLHNRTGEGNDFLGWIDLPENYNKEEFERILKASDKIMSDSDVLVVIGIGGSYLGARAAIEALQHSFYNGLPKSKRGGTPEIYYAGNSISPVYFSELMDVLEGKDVSVNVISKSGTTTEPAVAFRFFREFMEKKYGKAV
jgi:glucose-6-phosphate isomerase